MGRPGFASFGPPDSDYFEPLYGPGHFDNIPPFTAEDFARAFEANVEDIMTKIWRQPKEPVEVALDWNDRSAVETAKVLAERLNALREDAARNGLTITYVLDTVYSGDGKIRVLASRTY